jgi:hypothetical protein
MKIREHMKLLGQQAWKRQILLGSKFHNPLIQQLMHRRSALASSQFLQGSESHQSKHRTS